jgi:hypothetical protein
MCTASFSESGVVLLRDARRTLYYVTCIGMVNMKQNMNLYQYWAMILVHRVDFMNCIKASAFTSFTG